MKSMLMATIKRRGDLLMRVVGIIVLLAETARFVEAMKPGIPPVLPKQYQGNGNVLQALLNASWPTAQGPTTTYTFFAPRNSAVKVIVLELLPLFCIVVVLHIPTSQLKLGFKTLHPTKLESMTKILSHLARIDN